MKSNTYHDLPTDWTYKKLGDICKTTSGGTPKKSNLKYYENGTIPWLGSGEIKHRHITKYKNTITELALKESSAKIIKKGSLLLAMYGATVGEVGILTFDSSTNQAVCSIFENDNINQIYLYFYFISIKQQLKDMSFGAGQQNISQTVIKNLQIPIPPPATQKRIANILDKINILIIQYKQQLQAYDNLIRSQFYTLFGDPVINSKNYPMIKLGDIFPTLKNGCTIKQNNEKIGYPVTRIETIQQNKIDIQRIQHINQDISTLTPYVLQDGDILFSHINSPTHIGKTALYDKNIGTLIHGMNLLLLRTDKTQFNPCFLQNMLQHTTSRQRFKLRCNKAVNQASINQKALKAFEFIYPPLSEQEKFSQFVARIEILKSQSTSKIAQAEELFKSTSQQAFKGNI